MLPDSEQAELQEPQVISELPEPQDLVCMDRLVLQAWLALAELLGLQETQVQLESVRLELRVKQVRLAQAVGRLARLVLTGLQEAREPQARLD